MEKCNRIALSRFSDCQTLDEARAKYKVSQTTVYNWVRE